MADFIARIKPRKSSTAGEIPLSTDLEVAELAANTADGKLFIKHTDGTIKEISGGGGSVVEGSVRTNEPAVTTSALAQYASEDVTFEHTGRAGQFLKVEASCACWVVFYSSTAARTADATRSSTENPAQGTGVLMEVFFDQAETALITPSVLYFNDDPTEAAQIYAKVVNNDPTTQAVTVTATVVPTEGRALYEAEGAVRTTAPTITAASLADGASADLTLKGVARSGQFISVETNHAARVVFYSSQAARTADASRPLGTEATPGTGVIMEVVTTGAQTLEMTPAVMYHNTEPGAAGELYVKVENRSGSLASIAVTTTVVPIEGRGAYLSELTDLLDVQTTGVSIAKSTDFETGSRVFINPHVSATGGSVDSSLGTNAYAVPAADSYGDGSKLTNFFPLRRRYDIVNLKIRSSNPIANNNRVSLGGDVSGLTSSTGWALYTRNTGFGWYGQSLEEFGTRPLLNADTWYDITYVLDWSAGRNQNPAISLWVDGAIAADNHTPSSAFTPEPEHTDFYIPWASDVHANAGIKYWDDIICASSDTLPWGMSDSVLSGQRAAIENIKVDAVVGDALVWSGSKWVPGTSLGVGAELEIPLDVISDLDYDPAIGELRIDGLDRIYFGSSDVPSGDNNWGIYVNSTYGVATGRYDESNTNHGARSYYTPAVGVVHQAGDLGANHWFMSRFNQTEERPEIRLTSGNPVLGTGYYIGFKLPAGLTGDYTYNLPAVDGTAGQVLSTNGSGVMSWTDNADTKRIQDQEDFQLHQVTVSTYGRWVESASNTSTVGGFYPRNTTQDYLRISKIDADGNDLTTFFDYEVANSPADGVWISSDAQNWTSLAGNYQVSDFGDGSIRVNIDSYLAASVGVGNSLFIALKDPTSPTNQQDVPLAEGDVLQWDATDQKFKPTSDFISLTTLKAEVAAATDFANFQARIAAL